MTGEELTEKRLELAFSQEEMAMSVGVPIQTYRRWEQAKKKSVPDRALHKITNAEIERRKEFLDEDLAQMSDEVRRKYRLYKLPPKERDEIELDGTLENLLTFLVRKGAAFSLVEINKKAIGALLKARGLPKRILATDEVISMQFAEKSIEFDAKGKRNQ